MDGVYMSYPMDSRIGRSREFGALLTPSVHGATDWRNVGPGGGFKLASSGAPSNHVTPQPLRVVMDGPNSPTRQQRVKLMGPRGGMWNGRN